MLILNSNFILAMKENFSKKNLEAVTVFQDLHFSFTSQLKQLAKNWRYLNKVTLIVSHYYRFNWSLN